MQFKSSIGYTESIFVTTTYMTPYLQTYPISKIRLLGTNLSQKKSAPYPNLPHTKNTKCTLTSSKYGNVRYPFCLYNQLPYKQFSVSHMNGFHCTNLFSGAGAEGKVNWTSTPSVGRSGDLRGLVDVEASQRSSS